MLKDDEAVLILNLTTVISTELTTEPRGIITMLRHMHEAQAGIRSPNLEPHRGDRYELVHEGTSDEFPARIPTNDPTGESVAGKADEAVVALTEVDMLLHRIDKDMTRLRQMRHEWAPKLGLAKPADGPGDDWCACCYAADRTFEPVSVRYKGLCRWCGDFRAEQGQRPPAELVKARHRGERITSQMVDRHMNRKAS